MTQTALEPPITLRPRYCGRLVAPRAYRTDAPPGLFVADPGRFRLFAGWFSPWSHRTTLVVALTGLTDVVRVAYVDSPAERGAQALARLRRAYEADDPACGSVTVPALWDDETRRLVSNDPTTLDIDLATELRDWSTTGVELYPADLRDEIDDLDRRLRPAVNQGVHRALGTGGESGRARVLFDDACAMLDRRLTRSRYLIGERLTLADVRLWVTLVRYDPPRDGHRRISPALTRYPHLWAYAQDLYDQDAFQLTTAPATFAPAPDRPVAGGGEAWYSDCGRI